MQEESVDDEAHVQSGFKRKRPKPKPAVRQTQEKLSPTDRLLKRQVDLVETQIELMKTRNQIEEQRNIMINKLVLHFTGEKIDNSVKK